MKKLILLLFLLFPLVAEAQQVFVRNDNLTPLNLQDRQTGYAAVDSAGRLQCNLSNLTNLIPSTSTALEASRIIKASSGTLFLLTGYNSKTSDQYILIFDSSALPADGVAPTLPAIYAPAQSNFTYSFGVHGRLFINGIVVSNSSTFATKTIGGADVWYDGEFF